MQGKILCGFLYCKDWLLLFYIRKQCILIDISYLIHSTDMSMSSCIMEPKARMSETNKRRGDNNLNWDKDIHRYS